jgi:hypothetical protein
MLLPLSMIYTLLTVIGQNLPFSNHPNNNLKENEQILIKEILQNASLTIYHLTIRL